MPIKTTTSWQYSDYDL